MRWGGVFCHLTRRVAIACASTAADLLSLRDQRQIEQRIGSTRVRLEQIGHSLHALRPAAVGCLDRVQQLERLQGHLWRLLGAREDGFKGAV